MKSIMRKRWIGTIKTSLLCIGSSLVVVSSQTGTIAALSCPKGMSQLDCDALAGTWTDWVPRSGNCVQGASSTLSTYALPATSGKTGDEQPIDSNGDVIGGPDDGKPVTFSKLAARLSQSYRDYYITMRWNYVDWNWDGTSTHLDNTQLNWMAAQPRLVLVTNTRTGKSIIADALEAGPAPWTGVDNAPNDVPKEGWTNPQKGTPAAYTGRVSGFPPKAIEALGAQQGSSNGGGDILNYSWAPDQNAVPGPVAMSTAATASTCTTGGTTRGNAVFFSQHDPRWADKHFTCGGDCGTFSLEGCYLTDLAMIASTLTGTYYYPDAVANGGVRKSFSANMNAGDLAHAPYHLGVASIDGDASQSGYGPWADSTNGYMQQVITAVNAGELVLAHGNNPNGGPWVAANHWIVIRGYDAAKKAFLINDPWDFTKAPIPTVGQSNIDPNQQRADGHGHIGPYTYDEWPITAFYGTTNALYAFAKPGVKAVP